MVQLVDFDAQTYNVSSNNDFLSLEYGNIWTWGDDVRFNRSTSPGAALPGGYVGSNSISFVQTTPVPEPTTFLLLGIGIAGLAGADLRRRRKKRAIDNC